MSSYVCDKAMEDRLKDFRRGLHAAMTHVIAKNFDEAELVLGLMDRHLSSMLADLQIVDRR